MLHETQNPSRLSRVVMDESTREFPNGLGGILGSVNLFILA
jgi:hypothetical protein